MRKEIKVPYINQSPDYPTGCETISAMMYLKFLGIDVDIRDFIDNYLKKDWFEEKDGVTYGPDPNEAFVGSPYDSNSFGCFPKVIIKALTAYFSEKKLPYEALEVSHKDTEELVSEYIDKNVPVLYWTGIDMLPAREGPSWILKDSGEKYTWISNEHCLLLVGHDGDKLIAADPWNGNGIKDYPKEDMIRGHREHGEGAIVILEKDL